MTKILFILLLHSLVLAQVPTHIFDSPKADTSASGIIKPSHWDENHKPRLDTCLFIYDEFTGGSAGGGNIGMLGWSHSNIQGGAFVLMTGITNRAGLCSLATTSGTTGSGSSCDLFLTPVGTIGLIDTSGFFDVTFKAGLAKDTATTYCHIGLANNADVMQGTLPNDGLYFKTSNATSSNWYAYARNSTVGTDSQLVAVRNTNYQTFRIRRYDLSVDSVEFSIDGANKKIFAVTNTNFPNIALSPHFQLWNSDLAGTTPQALRIDYFQLLVTTLER